MIYHLFPVSNHGPLKPYSKALNQSTGLGIKCRTVVFDTNDTVLACASYDSNVPCPRISKSERYSLYHPTTNGLGMGLLQLNKQIHDEAAAFTGKTYLNSSWELSSVSNTYETKNLAFRIMDTSIAHTKSRTI